MCIASRPPQTTCHIVTGNNIHNIAYITIEIIETEEESFRKHMKTAVIDWDTFIHTARQLSSLRQISIQCIGYMVSSPRQILVEFLAHLREAWESLGNLLELSYRVMRRRNDRNTWVEEWVRVQLDTVMEEIKQRV